MSKEYLLLHALLSYPHLKGHALRLGGAGHTHSLSAWPFRPISAGLPGPPLQLQEKYPGLFFIFSRERTCRPAEKSNYNLLSWWNPITTSPMVRANPFDVKGSKIKRFQAEDVPVFYFSLSSNYTERLPWPWIAWLGNNGHDLLLPQLP